MNSQNPDLRKPIYVLHQSTTRSLVPKIATLLVLGLIFFLAVLLNLNLLELGEAQKQLGLILSSVLVILLVALGIFLSLHRAHQPYFFYQNKLIFGNVPIYYIDIKNIKPRQNILDKMFRTYSINLGDKFYIRHIPYSLNIQQYLQQLIAYATKT